MSGNIVVTKRVSLLKRPKIKVDLVKSRIIYDWLAFSRPDIGFDDAQTWLFGVRRIPFMITSGSNRFYEYMAVWQHIRIYYTVSAPEQLPQGYHQGIFVEMSGQGCREFEDYGIMSLDQLVDWCAHHDCNIARLDVAFDDRDSKHPLIDLPVMARQALDKSFTARSNKFKVDYSCTVTSDDDSMGISVQHGSRCSNFYLRCYDKRAERGVQDKVQHWVRLEMQLKNDVANGFVCMIGNLGERFRGALAHYVNYRDVNAEDTNKRRWDVSAWWLRLLDGVGAQSVAMACGTQYNKGKLDDFVYKRCIRAIIALLMVDGADKFFGKIINTVEKMANDGYVLPARYSSIVAQECNCYPEWLYDDPQLWWEYVASDQVDKYKGYFGTA